MQKIKTKLACGEYLVVDNTSSKAKSDVWEKFGLPQDQENNVVSGYAVCKSCKKVLAFEPRKLGTSSLRKHAEACGGNKSAASIDRFFSKNKCDLSTPARADKDTITNLAVKFVSRDIRSFETVCGGGFVELAQGLIDVGARAGRVDAAKLLPDPTTVSRRLTKYAEDIREKLIPELRNQLTESNAAITLDMWTDDYRKVGYLCVTMHYIDSKWELVERVLCTAEWDSSLRKTAENLRPAIMQALRKYNLEEFFPKLVYVTDRGANIVAALRTVTRLSCGAHILNTVLHTTLGTQAAHDDFFEEVSALIESAKSLVTYFKQTNLQNRLKKTLKAAVETRWNSLHTMLDSIHSQYEEVSALLEERGEEHRLTNLSTETLGDMVTFLARFKEATKALEASKTLTLHLAVVWLERLRNHLQPATTDSMTLSSLKKKGLRILNEKFQVHLLHKMAVFLHPKLKSLKLLADQTQGDVMSVHAEARRLVHEHKDNRGSPPGRQNQVAAAPPPEKRSRSGADDLADVEDSSDENAAQPLDEVAAYTELKTPKDKDGTFDVLSWWKEHATSFPNLALIARNVLAIPASSAASERDFSSAGFVIQERRTQLNPETVDDILFLHSNLRLKN